MMGSGKTTISKILADKLTDFSLLDIDEEIVKQEGISINDIFALKGEEYFRKIETEILKKVMNGNNQIISTGGGVVKSDENINLLKEKSVVFYLKTDEDVLYNRVKNDSNRPLLKEGDLKIKIHSILSAREQQYKKAHYIINSDTLPENIADEIIRKSGINANR